MATFDVVGARNVIHKVSIDDADWELCNALTWAIDKDGYVRNWTYGYLIGNIILDLPQVHVVEHIDGNKMNARRANLRDTGRREDDDPF